MTAGEEDESVHGDAYDLWANLPATDRFGFPASTILRTHAASICVPPCPLHAPSHHPLRDAPLLWRADVGVFERVCAHGVGHPDPDSVSFLRYVLPFDEFEGRALDRHGCDGCCSPSAA